MRCEMIDMEDLPGPLDSLGSVLVSAGRRGKPFVNDLKIETVFLGLGCVLSEQVQRHFDQALVTARSEYVNVRRCCRVVVFPDKCRSADVIDSQRFSMCVRLQ